RWLRVKIWMAVAAIARPLAGALGTPPVVGTWGTDSLGRAKAQEKWTRGEHAPGRAARAHHRRLPAGGAGPHLPREAGAGLASRHPGPPLPARRGHRPRRL